MQQVHVRPQDEPVKGSRAGALERAGKWLRRHPLLSGSAALLLFSYAFLTVALIIHRVRLLSNLESAQAHAANAEARLANTRRALYLADMGMAQEAWEQGDRDTARRLLEKHQKENDLRSFEWGHLWRVCHADRLTLATGRVQALAFSADGRALATVGETAADKEQVRGDIRLWDTSTGATWGNFTAPPASVRSVALAPVGRML